MIVQLDDKASLRIFATIDQTMTMLAQELKLPVGQERHSLQVLPANVVEENVFLVPYDKDGQRLPKGTNMYGIVDGQLLLIRIAFFMCIPDGVLAASCRANPSTSPVGPPCLLPPILPL